MDIQRSGGLGILNPFAGIVQRSTAWHRSKTPRSYQAAKTEESGAAVTSETFELTGQFDVSLYTPLLLA
ncbi:hypothetical protein A5699_26870 [Mycobacterium sp. E802]|nr:hypothetical protein A5699_26870 [Mycobacterium sp. E802]